MPVSVTEKISPLPRSLFKQLAQIEKTRRSGSSFKCDSPAYFTIRSFFTETTSATPRAASPAFVTPVGESTNPLNWTTPL